MPIAMHKTVPDCVRSIVSSPERLNELTSGQSEVGVRLVSVIYPEMRAAWARVCKHSDPDFPMFFFDAAAGLPAVWQRMPKTPTKKLQARVADTAAAADALAALLDVHRYEIDFYRGSQLTFHDVMLRARTIYSELAGLAGPPDPWSYAGRESYRIAPPSVWAFVRALGEEIRRVGKSSLPTVRPTKVGAKTAERTFMAKSLSAFFKSAFGDYCFDVVAVTVNTILDSKDDLLDAKYTQLIVLGPPPRRRKITRRD